MCILIIHNYFNLSGRFSTLECINHFLSWVKGIFGFISYQRIWSCFSYLLSHLKCKSYEKTIVRSWTGFGLEIHNLIYGRWCAWSILSISVVTFGIFLFVPSCRKVGGKRKGEALSNKDTIRIKMRTQKIDLWRSIRAASWKSLFTEVYSVIVTLLCLLEEIMITRVWESLFTEVYIDSHWFPAAIFGSQFLLGESLFPSKSWLPGSHFILVNFDWRSQSFQGVIIYYYTGKHPKMSRYQKSKKLVLFLSQIMFTYHEKKRENVKQREEREDFYIL